MGMFENYETDKVSEREGIWIDYGEFRVRIARAGGANKNFQKALERMSRPYRRAIATDSLDNEVAEGILRKAYAKAIILAWETKVDDELQPGIEQKDSDELMEFNEDNVAAVLKALPDLFRDLQEQAGSMALFKSHLREDAAGN
ncbi:MAG: hypothetical protein GY906_12165 [bacterium]|nr:hypothetical protein [bacterium]